MTTYELTQHLHTLLRATDKDRHFVRYVFVLARAYDRLGMELMEGLTSRNRLKISCRSRCVLGSASPERDVSGRADLP